ncbi:hypothetical protein [Nonomuraea roseoviolacea]|uniref:PH domain-containing protein n=1 Tax=Nonomuraea roseoviolacea subsp. carminata TaxID=160689 RepID=A0ABT1JW19_9ACTN|nr:hypothetical protein [Nonomuraea roseoviolacea]MCP2345961.1 hypothetical protein [Nonomuraea roseoviolacea subsp. carminata]
MSTLAATPGQEIYVTSHTIGHVRDRCDDELKEWLVHLRQIVATLTIGPPGFGIVGDHVIGGTYDAICREADGLLGGAQEAVESWVRTLDQCQRNWRAAEDHSIVKYR